MKRLWLVASLIVITCVFLMSCNEIKISDNNYSEYDGVYMTIESVSYYDDHKVINVIYHNETDYTVTFGLNRSIKHQSGSDFISVSTADVEYHDTEYTISPHSTYKFSYSTEYFDVSKGGTYRLYTNFRVKEAEIKYCSTYVEFEVTSVKSYKVTMKDEEWLFEDLKDRYYEGEKVTVKIGTVTDTGYLLLANGKNVKEVIPNSDGSYDYWEFEFTMPSEDVVLEFKTYDGFLRYPNEGRLIESYILANPDVESAWVDRYYGEYESGAIVAIIQSRNDAEEKLCTDKIHGFSFTYPNENTAISVYHNSSFYTLREAYKNGYLTDANLENIYKKHISFFDEIYFDITYFPGFSDLDANADRIVVKNFNNYTADGFEFEITDKDEIKEILETVLSATIVYAGEFIAPGYSSCQTMIVYKGDKVYEFSDGFVLSNGWYHFDKHTHCDRICELATESGAWDEIKSLNDVAMYGGYYHPFYVPDTADSISIGTLTDCYEIINDITFTDKKKVAEILDILKRAKISNYDSPTSGTVLYINIKYSVNNGIGTSNIESQFDLRNRYFIVNTNELENYIKTIE